MKIYHFHPAYRVWKVVEESVVGVLHEYLSSMVVPSGFNLWKDEDIAHLGITIL